MANDDLHEPLRSIQKLISSLRQDVQALTGEVKKIPVAIRESADSIRDAIQENIQAQAELKLMDHVMEVQAVKPQIEAEQEQIRTEREEREERLESIDERYAERQAELDAKASERVRDLGSHIFAVDEEQFEAGVEVPFTEQVTTAWAALQGHNEAVRDERVDAVTGTAGEVVQAIHDFVDRQAQLVETIDDHRLDADEGSLPADRTERLQVPYYVVTYEANGVEQREVVVPSRLSTVGSTDWCGVSLDPVAGAEDLLGGVRGVDDPARTESLGGDEIGRLLDRYGESSPLGTAYADAVDAALPDDGTVPVRVAGGDD